MTEIQTNGMELSSDPLADQILEIVNGATKWSLGFKSFTGLSSKHISLER
jgi:hypothetical protein